MVGGEETLVTVFSSVALIGPEVDFSSAFLTRLALLLQNYNKNINIRKLNQLP